jgi:hypothetical protein
VIGEGVRAVLELEKVTGRRIVLSDSIRSWAAPVRPCSSSWDSRSSPRPAHRRRGIFWPVSPRSLTLIAAVSEPPTLLGTTYGAVPG